MAYISGDEITDIRSAANIVDIIGGYIPLTPKGKNYVCVCPFHDDHSPSMSVSQEKQIYKCFSCGATGNVFTFVENYENVSFSEAVSIVASKVGRSLSVSVSSLSNKAYKEEYEIMSIANKFYQNNLNTEASTLAREYLDKRKINEDIIKEFSIGLSLDKPDDLYKLLSNKKYDLQKLVNLGLVNVSKDSVYDFFTKRITFPLWDKDGNIVAFSARIYRDEKDVSKYMNSKETTIFKKGDTLYNYHKAKDYAKREKFIIVVEGFMDAIRLCVNNIKNVVALQGTALTKDQINLLKKLRCKVILCLDNDEAGATATINNGDLLSKEGINVSVIRLTGEKDPDEYILKNGIEAFKENLTKPISYFEFKINQLKQNKDLNNSKELAEYINEVIKELSDISDDILKNITLNKISKEYDISLDILNTKLQELTPSKQEKVKIIDKKVVQNKKDAYNIGASKILFFMMNDPVYINMFQKKLGTFDNKTYRNIANEILYYYEKHKTINLADFITYIENSELKSNIMDIVNDSALDEINIDYMNEYLNSVEKCMVNNKIKELKEKLKNELDADKKLKIVQKISELKKGSVE